MVCLWNTLWLGVFIVAGTSAVDETVETTSGAVRGIHVVGTDVVKFLGIPYAEPPIGERRFKPPVLKSRISGTFDATTNGYLCPQKNSAQLSIARLFGTVAFDEDCLNLNIFAPLAASKTSPLSVMVWVHGGGFSTGSGSIYESTILAGLNDVIVVTINYRLGILGFLSTLDDNSVGNFGLRDQCLALQWVKDNIDEFGGNSSSITIFGQSAGASSVTQLTMAASCAGLFHRVISQSGSPLAPWAHNPDPLESARKLGDKFGCATDNTTSLVQCLRGKSVDELLSKQAAFDLAFLETVPWVPVYTSDFFSYVPKELPAWSGIRTENKMSEFDFMTGINMEEGAFFYENWAAPSRDDAIAMVANASFPGDSNRAEKLIPSLRFQYTDWQNLESEHSSPKMLIELIGDMMFHVSSVQYARLHAEFSHSQTGNQSGRPRTYFYRLRPRPSWMTSRPWTVGASHSDDLMFLFGVPLLEGAASLFFQATDAEKHFSHVMMEYWTNFAKTGDPNEPSKRYITTEWPIYRLDTEKYIELDLIMTNDSTGRHPYANRVAFWDSLIPEQVKLLQSVAKREPCDCKPRSPDVKVYMPGFPTPIAALLTAAGLISAIQSPYLSNDAVDAKPACDNFA